MKHFKDLIIIVLFVSFLLPIMAQTDSPETVTPTAIDSTVVPTAIPDNPDEIDVPAEEILLLVWDRVEPYVMDIIGIALLYVVVIGWTVLRGKPITSDVVSSGQLIETGLTISEALEFVARFDFPGVDKPVEDLRKVVLEGIKLMDTEPDLVLLKPKND